MSAATSHRVNWTSTSPAATVRAERQRPDVATSADARRARSCDRALRGGTGVHLGVLSERWIRGNESSVSGKTPGWRWRESNPRPSTHHQGFSERILPRLYLAPSITQTSRCDGPSRCLVSRARLRPTRAVSHLADARTRVDDEPGLTDTPSYRQAARA